MSNYVENIRVTGYSGSGRTGTKTERKPMFESHLAAQAIQDDDCAEFLDLYAQFRQDVLDPNVDRLRIARFEAKIDKMWLALPREKRDIITAALLTKKMLPEEAALAIKHLKARIVRIV